MQTIFRRPNRAANPIPVYLLLSGGSALFFNLIFTINMIYQATVVGLSPLQLVLVGTVLEIVCFTFEVPTGIVADVYSRRLSIIIGLALVGAGFILEGSVPTFAAVLACQVLWGIGATFLSGATEAWIVDEVGEEAAGPVFLRATQAGLAGTILGIVLSAGLGLISIQLPIVLGGLCFIGLAIALTLIMPERNFHRTPVADRSTLGHMTSTFRAGMTLARGRPVVLTLLGVSLFVGLASEAYDRLSTVHVLTAFEFPALFGSRDPVLWFGFIGLVGTFLGLIGSEVLKRLHPESLQRGTPARILTVLAIAQVAATLTFALAGYLWLAITMMWARGIIGTLAHPIEAAWMNRNLDSKVRATVLSMSGQANAIGQIAGGPPLGWVGNVFSIRAALVGSALVLSPLIALYARSTRYSDRAVETTANEQVTSVAD